jgi:hypothetical protein
MRVLAAVAASLLLIGVVVPVAQCKGSATFWSGLDEETEIRLIGTPASVLIVNVAIVENKQPPCRTVSEFLTINPEYERWRALSSANASDAAASAWVVQELKIWWDRAYTRKPLLIEVSGHVVCGAFPRVINRETDLR